MTNNTAAQTSAAPIALTELAGKLIAQDVSAFKRDRKRYSDYVAEMEVLAEDVATHVALFRDAYRAAFPKAPGDEVKAYATKVRNGLNYWVGKADTTDTDDKPVNLLTTDGLAQVTALIDAEKGADVDKIVAAIYAEVERRTASK